MKADVYPMHKSPRCTARSKRTGLPCCNPAVRGWKVCRMHGARGGQSSGQLNPAFKHGGRTKEAEELRQWASELMRESRAVTQILDS
jgi:hypothetical protein